MTMPDTILFVKEAKTCSYVLVIHTPRLCSEPGFKSRLDSREESPIRCREIVDSQPADQKPLSEADHPSQLLQRKSVLPVSTPPPNDAKQGRGKDEYADILKRALDVLLNNKRLNLQEGEFPQVVIEGLSEDGDVVFEFVDELPLEGEAVHNWLADVVHSAGAGAKREKAEAKRDNDNDNDRGGKDDKRRNKHATDPENVPEARDEL
jgi:protein OS-9